MEVTQSTFAHMAGVSRAAVCTKIKNKTLILNSGGMLDTDNPVNRAYLDKWKGKQQNNAGFGNFEADVSSAGATAVTPDFSDIQSTGQAGKMLNMTIRELVRQYGSMQNVEKYVKILRDLVSADEKDQRIQERRQVQIPKDFVTASVMSYLETLMNKLLDLPERIANQAVAFVQADVNSARMNIVNLMSDDISAAIGDSKAQILQKIQNLQGKYSQEDNLRDIVSEAMEKSE